MESIHSLCTSIYGIYKGGTDEPICRAAKETQAWRTDAWTQQGRRGGQIEGVALKHTHSHVEIRLSMRLPHDTGSSGARSGALQWWDGEGRGRAKRKDTYVYLSLIHVDGWQRPIQFCKAAILQLKINFKKSYGMLQKQC